MRDERIAQRSKPTQSITPNFHALSPLEVCVNSSTLTLTCTLQSSRAPAHLSSFDFVSPRMTLLLLPDAAEQSTTTFQLESI
jgi:hypothetical protein